MIPLKKGDCSGCNAAGVTIVNAWYRLCIKCNSQRIGEHKVEGEKAQKQQITFIPKREISPKTLAKIKADNDIYVAVWESKSSHNCEECGRDLGGMYAPNGRIKRWIFSHIISKGARPDMRSDTRNFNLLCYDCHQQYEFGDRRAMKIWPKNEEIIELLKSEYRE
jgi:hypothetical protein